MHVLVFIFPWSEVSWKSLMVIKKEDLDHLDQISESHP